MTLGCRVELEANHALFRSEGYVETHTKSHEGYHRPTSIWINIALRYDYIPLDEVLTFLREEKPPTTHVVLTGRNAHERLIEQADLVTEMELVKHPFRSGVKAQAGVDF